MTPEFIAFVGRDTELGAIKESIDLWGQRCVICIDGPGGIGKTRLLQEVRSFNIENVFIAQIIDFDDLALRIPANIEFTIARQLGPEVFEPYRQSLQTYHHMRRTGASSGQLAQMRLETRRIFVNGFNEYSARHRVVLLLDTTDTLESTEAWRYIVEELSQRLQNLVLVIAGRNARKIYEELVPKIGQDAQLIELGPLSPGASELYLQQKLDMLHVTLEPEQEENLRRLANGRPILIDLAVEWLAREIPGDWSLADLKPLPADKVKPEEAFEFRLVRHIAKIRTDMDRLTLAMSHVYPLDVEMIADLLKMTEDRAQGLFEEAKTYVFVRPLDDRISLHDEMRRMVNEYVWPEVGEPRRRWYSDSAVRCLDRKAEALQSAIDRFEQTGQVAPVQRDVTVDPFSERAVLKQQLWTFQVRALRHRMYLKPKQGFEEFERLFQNAFRGRESDFCVMLSETAEMYRDSLEEEEQIRLALNQSLVHILKGNPEAAMSDIQPALDRLMARNPDQGFAEFERLFQDAFDRGDSNFCKGLRDIVERYGSNLVEENQIRLDLSEGLLDILKGDLGLAVDRIHAGVDRLEERGATKDLDRFYNALGYCYRLQGNWESSIESYEQALHFSAQDQDIEQIAETMNNIANVCRFNGDFERGLRYTKTGLQIRDRLGDKLSIANSRYVRGMILWEIGNAAEAAAYLARARNLYEELDDQVHMAWVDKYTGYFHYRIGDVDTATEYLTQAMAVFRDRTVRNDLADTLNMLSRVTRRRNVTGRAEEAVFEQAERYALEGLEIAREIGDRYKIAECSLSLFALYYRWGEEHQIHGRQEQADRYYAQAQECHAEGFAIARDGHHIDLLSVYHMYAGNMVYGLGQSAYVQGDKSSAIRKWDEAFRHYVEECRISAAYKEIRFDRALHEIAYRLMRLPAPDLTQKYCNDLMDQWRKRGLEQRYPQLVAECEQVKAFLDAPEEPVVSRFSRAQADLFWMGDWEGIAQAGQHVLEHNRVYLRNATLVHALNASAFALRQLGRFSEARRLCTQGLHIGEVIEDRAAAAESHYVLGTIQWIVGNTAEAATHLRIAREFFGELDDDVGVARVRRYEGFLYYRIGNLDRALELLGEAQSCFEEHKQLADLADALTVEGRILFEAGRYEQARQNAVRANEIARKIGNNYVIAETLINLYSLYPREVRIARESGDRETAADCLVLAQQCLQEGAELAHRFGYDLLISVYERIAGDVAFDQDRLGQAFEHYVAALEHGARFEYARLHRTLDPCLDRLAQLPADQIRYYADYAIREWKARGLDTQFPDVVNAFELIKEYREYVSQA